MFDFVWLRVIGILLRWNNMPCKSLYTVSLYWQAAIEALIHPFSRLFGAMQPFSLYHWLIQYVSVVAAKSAISDVNRRSRWYSQSSAGSSHFKWEEVASRKACSRENCKWLNSMYYFVTRHIFSKFFLFKLFITNLYKFSTHLKVDIML